MASERADELFPFGYAEAFLATLEESSRNSCKSTLKAFREYVAECEIDPRDLTSDDVESWKRLLDRTQKPASVNRKLVALNAFYRWLSEKTGCANIVEGVARHPNQPLKKKRPFDKDQVESILGVIGECRSYKDYRDRAIVHLLLLTGVSYMQLRNLKVEDLLGEEDPCILRVKSKNGEALIPLSTQTHTYIREYLKKRRLHNDYYPSSPLFTNVTHRNGLKPNAKLKSNTVGTAVDRILKKAGLSEGIGEYSFQHTAMMLAIEGGATIREVEELAILLKIPRRFFLDLDNQGVTWHTAFDSIGANLEQMSEKPKKGVVKCSDLKRALDLFDDNDLLDVRIDEEGDLKIIPVMKTSKISFGLTL